MQAAQHASMLNLGQWTATLALSAAAALLVGCASANMQALVGKDIREVMLNYGPPANAFDMGDGRRAFQWVKGTSYTMPSYATTTSTVSNVGRSSWVTSNTQITGGQTVNARCIYSLFATWSDSRQGWTVVGFNKPEPMCE